MYVSESVWSGILTEQTRVTNLCIKVPDPAIPVIYVRDYR